MLKKISISMLALCALSSSAFAQEADLPYTATADGQALTFKEVHNTAGGEGLLPLLLRERCDAQ